MNHLFDLRDRVIVVTGAFGQLGAQYCHALHGAGARVVALDLDASRRTPPQPLADIYDGRLFIVDGDVTDRSSLEAALAVIADHWTHPTGLVNNAGIDSPPGAPTEENGPFETYPVSSFERVLDVNTKGVMLCCQVFGGRMAEVGEGAIVNICSIYGVVSPDQRLYEYRRRRGEIYYKPVAYSISKAALPNLSRYLATYWASRGVRVNTLTLGGVQRDQDEPFLEEYRARVPVGRMASEDEYNGAVVFLLSDASSYMTGANVVIDGGWTAW